MHISTNHNVNDTVYFMRDNRVHTGTIIHVYTDTHQKGVMTYAQIVTTISYMLADGSTISQEEAFATKQQLVDSL